MSTVSTISETVSRIFREAFESHPARNSDPGLALASARETASEAVPAGITGSFSDEYLSFTPDRANVVIEGIVLDPIPGSDLNRARDIVRALLAAGWRQEKAFGPIWQIGADGRAIRKLELSIEPAGVRTEVTARVWSALGDGDPLFAPFRSRIDPGSGVLDSLVVAESIAIAARNYSA